MRSDGRRRPHHLRAATAPRAGRGVQRQHDRITGFTDADDFARRPITLGGDPRMHVEADTVVRGIPVHTLRIDCTHAGATVFAMVCVDRRSYLPVRMIEGPKVIDYHSPQS